jgi:hypothetical protein
LGTKGPERPLGGVQVAHFTDLLSAEINGSQRFIFVQKENGSPIRQIEPALKIGHRNEIFLCSAVADWPPAVPLAAKKRALQAAGISQLWSNDLDDIERNVCRAGDGRPFIFATASDFTFKTDSDHVFFIEPVNTVEAPYIE